MKDNNPSSAWDRTWLITKVIVFLGIHLLSIISGVCLAVWSGTQAADTTGSRTIGLLVGISAYMAAMAGRDWVNFTMSNVLFSGMDLLNMKAMIEGKRGPDDTRKD